MCDMELRVLQLEGAWWMGSPSVATWTRSGLRLPETTRHGEQSVEGRYD
jgi:hypothetical protein